MTYHLSVYTPLLLWLFDLILGILLWLSGSSVWFQSQNVKQCIASWMAFHVIQMSLTALFCTLAGFIQSCCTWTVVSDTDSLSGTAGTDDILWFLLQLFSQGHSFLHLNFSDFTVFYKHMNILLMWIPGYFQLFECPMTHSFKGAAGTTFPFAYLLTMHNSALFNWSRGNLVWCWSNLSTTTQYYFWVRFIETREITTIWQCEKNFNVDMHLDVCESIWFKVGIMKDAIVLYIFMLV